jgi:hypothetical protein
MNITYTIQGEGEKGKLTMRLPPTAQPALKFDGMLPAT